MNTSSINEIKYENKSNSLIAFSGDSKILTQEGWISLNKCSNKVIRCWNGTDYSFISVKPSLTNQPLFEVKLNDERTLLCSLYVEFLYFNKLSIKLKDIIKKKQKHEIQQISIYTNKIDSLSTFEFVNMISVKLYKNNKQTFNVSSINCNHNIYIDNVLITV